MKAQYTTADRTQVKLTRDDGTVTFVPEDERNAMFRLLIEGDKAARIPPTPIGEPIVHR